MPGIFPRWWNRLDSNQHDPWSACFTLILPPECAITSLFHICPVCYAGRCFVTEKRGLFRSGDICSAFLLFR